MINKKQPVFEETHTAAKLLEEFHALTQKSKPENATQVFFDKDYLTMADFLAPVGSVLSQPKHENIHEFITSSVHNPAADPKPSPFKGKKLQTIKDFLTSLN